MLVRVMVNGCFDILHVGHICLLEWAASFGNVHIALNSDKSVKRLKGPQRPVFNQEERKHILLSIRYVISVTIFNEDTPEQVIEFIDPDVIIVGYDHSINDPHYRKDGRQIIQAPHFPGIHSTNIIERIQNG